MKHRIIILAVSVGLVLLLNACFTPLKPGCHRERVIDAVQGPILVTVCDNK